MKNKILTIFTIILILGIGVIQYRIYEIKKQFSEKGKVKSAQVDLTSNIPNFDTNSIFLLPKKIEKFHSTNILARNYILLDVDTNYPLVQKDAHAQVPIASTTKITTAIVILENYNLNDVITISSNAASQIGSETMLKKGEKMTVESLLFALLVQSGNDAAMALAEHYPTGLNGFVEAMNAKVQYLGLKDTKFKDPAGLDDEGKSSAYDLAIVASYALKNPIFSKTVKTSQITIYSIDGKISHQLNSSNRLIKSDEPLYHPLALGIKTGFTPLAGHCLVSAAEKNGKILVGVILNTHETTNDASAKETKKLLEWGFDNYRF